MPTLLARLLELGVVAAVVVALSGIVLAIRSPAQSTPMNDRAVRRSYGIVVGLEFGVLGVGAAVLAMNGQAQWIAVWICAGVGVHFVPLSRVLGDRSLVALGVGLMAVAAAAWVVGASTAVAPSTITGCGAGLCLLVSAAFTFFTPGGYTVRLPGVGPDQVTIESR